MLAAKKSPRFTVLFAGFLFILFVALLFHLPSLFFMAAALIVAPAVSYLLAALGLGQIRAERRLPARLWPDERVDVELRLENRAWLPKCLLRVDERLPEGLEGDPADPPGCVVPMLWADPYTHRYPLIAKHRGRYVLDPVLLTAVDTFDLFNARRVVGPPNEVVVYPRRVSVKDHSLFAASYEGEVRRRRPMPDGLDFRATREYRPGDDLRRVHWRSTARRSKLIVVEFEEPATAELFIVLDVSAGSPVGQGKDNTFETGVTLAASVIEHELEQGNGVGLLLDGPETKHIAVTSERHRLLDFFEALAVVEADGPRPFAQAVVLATELLPRGSHLLLISGGLDPAVVEGIGLALRRRHGAAFAYLDPRGYPGYAGTRDSGFLAAVRGAGAGVFRIRRGQVQRGLTEIQA